MIPPPAIRILATEEILRVKHVPITRSSLLRNLAALLSFGARIKYRTRQDQRRSTGSLPSRYYSYTHSPLFSGYSLHMELSHHWEQVLEHLQHSGDPPQPPASREGLKKKIGKTSLTPTLAARSSASWRRRTRMKSE